jgi:hypothetical protein
MFGVSADEATRIARSRIPRPAQGVSRGSVLREPGSCGMMHDRGPVDGFEVEVEVEDHRT